MALMISLNVLTKLRFRNQNEPEYIKFSSAHYVEDNRSRDERSTRYAWAIAFWAGVATHVQDL